MAQSSDALAALKAALETIPGVADSVRVGGLSRGQTPQVCIQNLELSSVHGASLGDYRRVLVVDLAGCVAATSDGYEARLNAALALLDEVVEALEADRTLGGVVYDLVVQRATPLGGLAELPGVGVFYAQVELYWHAVSGEGV